jgi:hypothetical protein
MTINTRQIQWNIRQRVGTVKTGINKTHMHVQTWSELKKLLIKGCYYSIEDYLNEEFSNIGY